MTKAKSSQARATKRNARAKAKKVSANKARTTPSELNKKSFRKEFTGNRLEFDQVLANAVRDVNKRKEVSSEINSPQEMIVGLQKAAGEVFKLYSYITLVEALNEQKIIDQPLVIDLFAVSADLINIDKRIQNLVKLLQNDEEDAVVTECLDIGTTLSNYAEELYAEVSRAEKHALIIEETWTRLAKEIEGIDDPAQQRLEVLQSFAYQYLTKVKEEVDSKANPTPQAETEVAVAE